MAAFSSRLDGPARWGGRMRPPLRGRCHPKGFRLWAWPEARRRAAWGCGRNIRREVAGEFCRRGLDRDGVGAGPVRARWSLREWRVRRLLELRLRELRARDLRTRALPARPRR